MKYTLFFLYFFLIIPIQAQEKTSVEVISKKIDKVIVNSEKGDPKTVIEEFKKLRNEALDIKYYKGAMTCTYKIINAYLITEINSNNIIEETKLGEEIGVKAKDYRFLADILTFRSIAYREQGFYDTSLSLLEEAFKYSEKIPDDNKRFATNAMLYGNMADYYNVKKDNRKVKEFTLKSLDENEKINPTTKDEIMRKKHMSAQQNIGLGFIYQENRQLDSAEYHFLKSYDLFFAEDSGFPAFEKPLLLQDLSNLYFEKKNYKKSIAFAKRSLSIFGKSTTADIRKNLYENLYKSYLEEQKIDSSKYYSDLFTKLNDSLILANKADTNTSFRQLANRNKSKYEYSIKRIIFFSFTGLVLIFCLFLYLYRKSKRNSERKYKELIEKMKNHEATISHNFIETGSEKGVRKTAQIIDDTLMTLLNKLDEFERSSKFLNKNISLASLATDLETNTTYLSQIINNHKNKNFNNYINALRIEYIIKELYNNPIYRKYKTTALAEISGFSSREVFTSTFKKETGMSPSFLIKKLEDESLEP